jgi:hypothetical protein
MNQKEKMLAFITEKTLVSPHNISQELEISRVLTHRYLAQLLEEKKIRKIGKAPKVFYEAIKCLKEAVQKKSFGEVSEIYQSFIEKNYIKCTPSGEIQRGFMAFSFWCEKTKQDLEKTAKDSKKCSRLRYHRKFEWF